MLNLQKLQSLSTFQQEQSIGNSAATAAALASLQGLAAGIQATAAAAALNSPLNLSVANSSGIPTSMASELLNSHKVMAHITESAGNSNGCDNQNNHSSSSPNHGANSLTGGGQSTGSSQNALANALSNAAAAAAAAQGTAATASPPPQLQAPPASSQMPQLILASGQLVQGVQGAQLLIPTAQGKLQIFIISRSLILFSLFGIFIF